MSAMTRRACRDCGSPIILMADEKGRVHPLDPEPPVFHVTIDLTGAQVAQRVDSYVSHFFTCLKGERVINSKKGNKHG